MSLRNTHILNLDIDAKTFASFDEAVKGANAVKRHIVNLCKKDDYSCMALIAVSENDGKSGHLELHERGKKVFVSTDKVKGVVLPHIHINIVANPASTLEKELKLYINKTFGNGENVVFIRNCESYLDIRVSYLMNQALKYRTVLCGDISVLGELGIKFQQAVNGCYSRMNLSKSVPFHDSLCDGNAIAQAQSFTKNAPSQIEEKNVFCMYNKAFLDAIISLLTLQCNNNNIKNNNTNKNYSVCKDISCTYETEDSSGKANKKSDAICGKTNRVLSAYKT